MSEFIDETQDNEKSEFKVSKMMMIGFLTKYAAIEKWWLLLGIILTFVRVGLLVLSPIVLAEIFNLIQKREFSDEYVKWGVLYISVYLLGRVLDFVKSYVMDYTVGKISYRIRTDVYKHLQSVPLSYYDSMPAGSIVSRIMSDTNLIELFFRDFLVDIFAPIVNIVFAFAALFILDINLAIIELLSMPIMIGLIVYLIYKVKEPLKLQRRQVAEITAAINESVQGIDVISSLNREEFRIKQIDEKTDAYNRTRAKTERTQVKLQWTLYSSIQYLVICIGIAYFGYGTMVWGLPLSLGSIYVFIKYSEGIQENLQGVSFKMERMVRSFAAVDHLCEIFQLPREEVKELGGISEIKGSVEYRNVNFSYVKEEQVLHNMNLKLNVGETIALVGRTGSGKSTIANLLFKFYNVDSGEILIDGRNLSEYPLYKLREEMGIVLQEPFLFKGTLYDNISLGNPKISKEAALEALKMIGAKSILQRFNNDIMAPVNTQGKEFSQGERQLISFARALAHNPKILILDEATSSIDTETEQQIRRAIEVLAKNRSMIIIAHRLSTIQHADCIYVLDHGEVKEKGKHAELIELGGIYYHMAKQQEIC